jgi:hypothetical protein
MHYDGSWHEYGGRREVGGKIDSYDTAPRH